MLHVLPITAFDDNYIWLIVNSENRSAAVIDPGDAQPVIAYCAQNNITLCNILITHHHHDHTGGIAKLVEQYNIPVFGPTAESIPLCQYPLQEGDEVVLEQLDNLTLKVLDIPGHTRGHIAYLGHGWLFCGDTLFAGGCGRIFEGTAEQLYHSLQKLKQLDPRTLIFCAHEYTLANLKFAHSLEADNLALQKRIDHVQHTRNACQPTLPSTLAEELSTNPFLRCDERTIRLWAEQQCGQTLPDPLSVFTIIRKMKDTFRA